jgi:hypothetical protein
MLFHTAFHQGLRNGSIIVTFRRWKAPQVKAGGSYRLDGDHVLEVQAVDVVPVADISETDARRAGFSDREALLAELGKRAPLTETDGVYRERFSAARRPDERGVLAQDATLTDDEAAHLARRLDKMDARSDHGPWTRTTLSFIEQQPRVLAARLARQLGRERLPFKADVRKLKALGLTISHDAGYELSPRGRAFLAWERNKV